MAEYNTGGYNFINTFYNSACQICVKAYPDIHHCSACKTVAYCSKEHQKQDWPSHKTLCKVIEDTNNRFPRNCKNFEEWKEYRVALRFAWESTLNRVLKPHEVLMTMYPPACAICYSKVNLYYCRDCLNVQYCSKQHENAHSLIHKQFCSELKLGLIIEQYLFNHGMEPVKFIPASQELLKFPESTRAFSKYIRCNNILQKKKSFLTEEEKSSAVDIVNTGLIAVGLSMLYGIQITKIQNHYIVIHIVGASFLEFITNWSVVTDILRYWLNNVKVSYHVIGPEVSQCQFKDTETENFKIKYYVSLYHQIIDKIEKPDLVVVFNCGFHEFEDELQNTWGSSLPMLLKYPHVPLLMTSYTEIEMKRDIQKIFDLHLRLNVVLNATKNPYRLLKPIRDWSSENIPVFYPNNYIFIVEKVDV